MAPEYAYQGIFSSKSDVFSFGVLVLEILSGKKNMGIDRGGNRTDLIGYVSIRLSANALVSWVDVF